MIARESGNVASDRLTRNALMGSPLFGPSRQQIFHKHGNVKHLLPLVLWWVGVDKAFLVVKDPVWSFPMERLIPNASRTSILGYWWWHANVSLVGPRSIHAMLLYITSTDSCVLI